MLNFRGAWKFALRREDSQTSWGEDGGGGWWCCSRAAVTRAATQPPWLKPRIPSIPPQVWIVEARVCMLSGRPV